MKKYFISKGNEKKGPYSIEQIKTMELTEDYFIWTDDFEDWKKITEMEELKGNIIITPPPTPKQLKKKKQKTAILRALKISGIWFLILWFAIFVVMGGFMNDYSIESMYGHGFYPIYGDASDIRLVLSVFSLLLSAIISIIILFFTYKSQLKNDKRISKKIRKVIKCTNPLLLGLN